MNKVAVVGYGNTKFTKNELPIETLLLESTKQLFDTTMGWRFINKQFQQQFGTATMPETAENVALQCNISRQDQDLFALRSQQKLANAQKNGHLSQEILAVPLKSATEKIFCQDEHGRANTTLPALNALPTPFKKDGSVTAGNASGLNDGACALLLASTSLMHNQGLTPISRVVGMATTGLTPNVMGLGPVSACQKVLQQCQLTLAQMDVIEINEAFAAQCLAVLRALKLKDDDPRVNQNGGAIALGHPLGMSGARLITTAGYQLQRTGGRYALCSMCVGVGQGIAMIIENANV